jgi:phospholipid transport system substrate-binding protein
MNPFLKTVSVFALVGALMPFTSLSGSQIVNEADPITTIQQAAGNILNMLEENRTEFEAHPDLLRDLVRSDFMPLIDIVYSARLILGKAGRGLSPEQLQDFADALSNVLLNRYSDGLLHFRSPDQLEVLPLKGRNTDKLTRVRTRIKLENGGYAPVDYAFHKTDTGWKAFDVTVEGISYVITLRNQIVPKVEAEGIEKVTADIAQGNVALND